MNTSARAEPGDPRLIERPAAASRVLLAQVMSQSDTNLYGSVHGGVVMKLIDDAAAAAAGRHAGVPALTVAVESMTFLAPAHAGDLLTSRAQLYAVGRTSMRIETLVTAERWNSLGPIVRIATARLIFVAIDSAGSVAQVPRLLPAGDDWIVGASSAEPAQRRFVPSESGQRPR